MADADLRAMYRDMLLIRRFEERAAEMYAHGKIGGFLHLYIGEEAVAVGALHATAPDDDVLAHYRDHGYALVRGIPPRAVMAELFGKATGCCGGRGGSMHLADTRRHFWGGYAIVAGHLPLAVGMAFARLQQGQSRVVVDFFGDGAMQNGYCHEAMNLAGLWKLPVLFICENNRYGMGTQLERHSAITDLATRADAYGMPGATVDGMDPVAVHRAASDALARARKGDGPSLLVCETYRFRGHSMADPESYRAKEEVAERRPTDPLPRMAARLIAAGLADDEALRRLQGEIDGIVADAVAFAEQSPDPAPATLTTGIYARNLARR